MDRYAAVCLLYVGPAPLVVWRLPAGILFTTVVDYHGHYVTNVDLSHKPEGWINVDAVSHMPEGKGCGKGKIQSNQDNTGKGLGGNHSAGDNGGNDRNVRQRVSYNRTTFYGEVSVELH